MKPNNIHIDVVEKYFIPVTAGIEMNILNTYSVIAKSGPVVNIHTSKDTLSEKNVLPDNDLIKGLEVKRYSYGIFGFLPNINWFTTDLVALHNFNVLPHFYILVISLGLKIMGRKRFALTLTPHGGFTPEWSIFPRLTLFCKYIYHFTIGTLLINAVVDKVRAVSEWERIEIIKKGVNADKVLTISNGIEDEAYVDVENLASTEIKNQVKRFGKYIIQIGRVYPIKNYETVIKSLINTPDDLNYLIVGPIHEDEKNKNYKKMLDELIESRNLKNRVFFLGVIKGVDKYYLIKHAQMMVHMAIWESFCNVVHEGLSQGLVCLVANNTALPLLVKDGVNGYCINTYDSNELSKKINFVLENKNTDLIINMKKRNKEFGSETSWTKVAHKMMDLYIKLIESNSIR